jgi:DNA-binding Xre family transcriptional regulator
MGIVNTIAEFAKAQGCKNAYEFWKITGLSQPTVYRLYNNPDAFPSKETQDAICKAFNAQPGDFLRYVPNSSDKEE